MLESKPDWSEVPKKLQQEIANKLGARVLKGEKVFGGFGPSATFRLYLEDGRTVFAKGAGKGSTPKNWKAISAEEYVYQKFRCIRPFSPDFLGSVKTLGWHLILLEDLKDATEVPPWTEKLAKQAVRGIAEFHIQGLAEKAKKIDSKMDDKHWKRLKENLEERESFLSLFPSKREKAESWFYKVIDRVIAAEEHTFDPNQPWGLIHLDIRSDNLRLREGKLILFDWSYLCSGPLILDITFFMSSVVGEGGPSAEVLFPEYKEHLNHAGMKFPKYCIEAAAAYSAGFFAMRAGQKPIPLLPRLRELQRMLLGPALQWMCTTLNLPQPPSTNFSR